jgi:hypothetical protein
VPPAHPIQSIQCRLLYSRHCSVPETRLWQERTSFHELASAFFPLTAKGDGYITEYQIRRRSRIRQLRKGGSSPTHNLVFFLHETQPRLGISTMGFFGKSKGRPMMPPIGGTAMSYGSPMPPFGGMSSPAVSPYPSGHVPPHVRQQCTVRLKACMKDLSNLKRAGTLNPNYMMTEKWLQVLSTYDPS